MKIFRCALLLGLLVAGPVAAEQGCPDGMIPNAAPAGTPGANQCIPIPSAGGGAWDYPVDHTSWTYNGHGAFAFDAKGKNIGVSDPKGFFAFVSEAKRSAMKSCKQNGGGDCKIIATYKNECAVSVLGATDSRGREATIYVGKGATESDARGDGQSRCKASGSPVCKLAYSHCAQRWSQ